MTFLEHSFHFESHFLLHLKKNFSFDLNLGIDCSYYYFGFIKVKPFLRILHFSSRLSFILFNYSLDLNSGLFRLNFILHHYHSSFNLSSFINLFVIAETKPNVHLSSYHFYVTNRSHPPPHLLHYGTRFQIGSQLESFCFDFKSLRHFVHAWCV